MGLLSRFPWLKSPLTWVAAVATAVVIGAAAYVATPYVKQYMGHQGGPIEGYCLNLDGTFVFNPSPIANPNGDGTVTLTGGGPPGYNATLVTLHSQTPGVTITSPIQQVFFGGTINGTWSLSGLTPGQTIVLRVDAVDPGHGSKPGTDSCCMGIVFLTVPGKINLGIKKVVTKEPAEGDNSVKYDLQVTNTNAPILYSNVVSISDVVPANLQINNAGGTNWDCGPPGQYPLAAGATLTCLYIGPPPIGTGAVLPPITLDATMVGDPKDTIVNCATVAPTAASGYIDTIPSDNTACANIYPQFDHVDPPPPYKGSCGQDVLFIVDESYSIFDPSGTGAGPNQTATVVSALLAGAHAFAGNGAQAEVIFFGTSAGIGTAWTPLTNASANTMANGYVPAMSPFGANTNWEAAMRLAATELVGHPNALVIFITDGKPNYYVDDTSGLNVAAPVDGSGNTTSAGEVLSTNQAIAAVNSIYALGNRIIGIGVGPNMTSPVPPSPDPNGSDHMHALLGNGPPVTGSGPFDPNTSNVWASNGFDFTDVLVGLAGAGCPKIKLDKLGYTLNFAEADFDAQGHLIDDQKLKAQVTLTVTNISAAPMTGVSVKDALPGAPNKVSIANPANYSQAGASAVTTVPRDTVTWNVVPPLAPFATSGDSQTLTFTVTVDRAWVEALYAATPPDGVPHRQSVNNFAQVTAVDQTVGTQLGEMLDDGPVNEIDESTAPIIISVQKLCGPPTDCNPPAPDPVPYLNVKKTFAGGGEAPCVVGQPCTFNITIEGNYLGPASFGDGIFNTTPAGHTSLNGGSTPIGTPTTATATTPAGETTQPICSPTSPVTQGSPWFCNAATFPTGFTAVSNSFPTVTTPYTFHYTISFVPTSTGSVYTNCFFALMAPSPTPTSFSDVYTQGLNGGPAPFWVNGNGPYAGPRGDCADVHTAGPQQMIQHPPPSDTKSVKVTEPPPCDPRSSAAQDKACPCSERGMKRNRAGVCACPEGSKLMPRKGCVVEKAACDPNSRAAQDRTCPCPERGMKRNRAGVCACPEGSKLTPRKGCVIERPAPECDLHSTAARRDACICRYPDMQRVTATTCRCPTGSTLVDGRGCVLPVHAVCEESTTVTQGLGCACRYPGMTQASPTQCTCPAGSSLEPGKGCGPICVAPMVMNKAHSACQCPEGMTLKDAKCVKKSSFFDNFHIGIGVGGGGGGNKDVPKPPGGP